MLNESTGNFMTINTYHSRCVLFIFMIGLLKVVQAAPEQALFWQIDKPGSASSYLLGTLYSEDKRIINIFKQVDPYLQQARSAVFEVLMDIPTLKTISEAMFLEINEPTLPQLIDKTIYNQVIQRLTPYHLAETLIKRLQPWAVVMMLRRPPPSTGQFLDRLLYEKAMQLNIPVYGLEKAAEQLQVFAHFSLKEHITLLQVALHQSDKISDIFEQQHQLYLARDLMALRIFSQHYLTSGQHQSLLDEFYRQWIDARTLKMMDKINPRLQAGHTFIAVSALHLPGAQGLLNLLRVQGYQVTALF